MYPSHLHLYYNYYPYNQEDYLYSAPFQGESYYYATPDERQFGGPPSFAPPGHGHGGAPTSPPPGQSHGGAPTSPPPGQSHGGAPTSPPPGHGHAGPPTSPPPGHDHGHGSHAGPPTSPPPSFVPTQTHQAGQFAIDPGGIARCLFRYTYVWLRGFEQFWFYPTFVGRTSVSGWRWTGFRWIFFGISLRQIQSFTCI